jgi:asparagine synthase (glutamine-hydrolysing)
MCGITGKLLFDPVARVEPDLVYRMADTLRHRGPDDGGVWTAGRIGLGSRRLAVIDLSPRGHQPMSNEDASAWIAFNGEIYNFKSLREDLSDRHAFHSHTDTETILHLYEEYGDTLLDRLHGMFAFALWDVRRQALLLARDRLGKKPLFYYVDDRMLVFGSEAKAILQDPDVATTVDPEALHHYLTFGYVPTPFSAFAGIRKLPPGHSLTWCDGTVNVRRYWGLSFRPQRQESQEELADELTGLLEDAVRVRLISDVPVGALLSGGLDSSAVVALMRRVSPGRVRTFSIGFAQSEYDELKFAREVARRFDTEHEELVVRPDAAAMLPRLVWHYNEPFADSSAIPSFLVSELARRSVTVALTGDGGDETFLGYDRYRATLAAGQLDRLPSVLRRGAARAAQLLPQSRQRSLMGRTRRFGETLAMDPRRRYGCWMTFFDASAKAALYAPEFAERVVGCSSDELVLAAYDRSDAPTFVEATAHADVQQYLPDDLLVKMDIASMASSLEVRSPLLDHRVVEFAASLPVHMKLRGRISKFLLREVMKHTLPESVLTRSKMGFGVPIDHWLRNELKQMMYDVLLDRTARARGYFRASAVQRYLDEHVRGFADHHHRIWALLMLELWHRTFIDRPCPAVASDGPNPTLEHAAIS